MSIPITRKTPHREDKAIDYVFRVLSISWWYYAIAIILAITVSWKWRWEGGLLIGYVFLLIAETVLIRLPFKGEHLNLDPLWSWREWSVQKNQILTNVIMFIPVGILSGLLWKWKGLLLAAGISCMIEILQLITVRGLCEFDDVLHNMTGAIVGVGIVMAIRTGKTMKKKTKINNLESLNDWITRV